MKTGRLDLVPFIRDELDLFHQTNINPFVRKYLWDDVIIPLETSLKILEEVEKLFENKKWGLWKIINSSNQAYMGYVGLWTFFDEEQPQLLYALLPEYTKFGYATEASDKVIEYAFNELNFVHLIASTDKPNVKSQQVCKRLNMDFVGEEEIDGKPTLFYKIDNLLEIGEN